MIAKKLSVLIQWAFAKSKYFASIFDSLNLHFLWMSFGKCKLHLRVEITLFLCKLTFNSNAIYSFQNTCKILFWTNKFSHQKSSWWLFHSHFNNPMRFDLKLSFQLHLYFALYLIFAEKLRLLVCKVLGIKSNLFFEIDILP